MNLTRWLLFVFIFVMYCLWAAAHWVFRATDKHYMIRYIVVCWSKKPSKFIFSILTNTKTKQKDTNLFFLNVNATPQRSPWCDIWRQMLAQGDPAMSVCLPNVYHPHSPPTTYLRHSAFSVLEFIQQQTDLRALLYYWNICFSLRSIHFAYFKPYKRVLVMCFLMYSN